MKKLQCISSPNRIRKLAGNQGIFRHISQRHSSSASVPPSVQARITRRIVCSQNRRPSSFPASSVRLFRQMSTKSQENEDDEIDPGRVNGTNMRIVKYPHPILRAVDQDVVDFDENLKQISREMFLVMYATRGVGLAAPQVGLNMKMMVFNLERDAQKPEGEVVFVNPRILLASDGMEVKDEGCLSFPGIFGPIPRHEWINIEAFDLDGKRIEKKLEDFEARVFQHELDHLLGRLFIDRLPPDRREQVQPALAQLVADHRRAFPGVAEAL